LGYDVHITRAENWFDNQGFEISSFEWQKIVQKDPELIPMPENGKYFVKWYGPTKYPDTWFDLSNGNIYTKAPDKETLRKMLNIANQLEAKVQGDEGEIYDERTIESFVNSFLNKLVSLIDTQLSSKSRHLIRILLKPLALLLIPFIVFIIFLIIEMYFK